MSIARDLKKNPSKPHRGGIAPVTRSHAAPMGLGRSMGMGRYYRHGAPLELGK